MAYTLWGDYATPTNFLRRYRSCYLVALLILKRLLGLAFWPSLFEKKVFLTLNSCLQSTCLTDRLLCEMDPIWTACRLRSNQSVGQFYAKSGKWKLVFLAKIWPSRIYMLAAMSIWRLCSHQRCCQESTSTPATTQVCNSLGWLLDNAASRQNFVDLKLYPLPVHGLLCKFCAHCNRQIGL